MRKKDIIKLNGELFERAERFQLAYEELKKENLRLSAKIEELMLENEAFSKNQVVSEPLKELEEKILANADVDQPTELGSQVIGKIIVSATQYCNQVTQTNAEESKELVNLILGRTEVAKAEILKIIENNSQDAEVLRNLILGEQSSAEDYFKSVLAQID